jgi:internalin A
MSYKIALERINQWKDGMDLDLNDLGLTEIPKEISSLTNLEFLNLSYNNIKDVTPIASLINLKGLYLHNNKIMYFSQLASLTKLKWLNLESNKIADVTPILSFVNLKNLYLTNNKIIDVTPLASLTNCIVHY